MFSRIPIVLLALIVFICNARCVHAEEKEPVRVFIFAGQSNMVGSDSKVEDVDNFGPFVGYGAPQPNVRFSYCIGRENKRKSDGWVDLQPVNNIVGPELSFAQQVTGQTDAPIAIIKVAAGGTHLGGDWNPDHPSGFEMYPLALKWIRDALADLKKQGIQYQLEGFVWHQGENDMFNEEYMANYGKNLKNILASWRRDLKEPELRFYIGELCTKTIWGMDLRPRMYAISQGQKEVTNNDPLADYIPTNHIGVEIGRGVGLHYHYGTLGQLEHGVNYADAYLRNIGVKTPKRNPLKRWPYQAKSKLKLFVLAGHRNMEGERAFTQHLAKLKDGPNLLDHDLNIAYKYNLGGGVKLSNGWEPLAPAGFYDTFGPELSFADTLKSQGVNNFAIAKFTHSGSQIIDWTPTGSVAKSRNLYPSFIAFIRDAVQELKDKGHDVELAGIFYHVGENDMSWGPFRKGAPERVQALINQSRKDLELPNLKWIVSQQPPTDDERVNAIDVTAELASRLDLDPHTIHFKDIDLPKQEKKLVIDTSGIVWLGRELAEQYLQHN